jgi:hypothetical protein
MTIVQTFNDPFVANTDIGDGCRFLSIVNDSLTTNAYSALSFRINPASGGGGSNAMMDMKFVNANSSNNSCLFWTFNSPGGFNDRMVLTSAVNLARKGFDYHTGGQWYKIPFYLEKGNGVGIADTRCIVVINNNDQFQELHFTIEYGSRLQGVTDQYTQTSLRTYGVNRFVGSTATINDVYLITGGSGCNINTHAPVTVAIAGSCMSVVKVDFSSSLGSSSFVWGEIRIWSIESLSGKISIPNNNY